MCFKIMLYLCARKVFITINIFLLNMLIIVNTFAYKVFVSR